MLSFGVVFLSAFLLFAMEFMSSVSILPLFGGGSAVWITSLAFYQTVLFLGYAYAKWLTETPLHAWRFWLHAAILTGALFFYPPGISASGQPPQDISAAAVWLYLTKRIGPAFFCLCSTTVLQHVLLSIKRHEKPYRIYSISNIGSFAALTAYPFLIQPHLRLSVQNEWWYAFFTGFAALNILSFTPLLTGRIRQAAQDIITVKNKPRLPAVFMWIYISAGTSSLLSSVTTIITANISPAPMIWTLPLCAYLLSYVLAFYSARITTIFACISIPCMLAAAIAAACGGINSIMWIAVYTLFLFSVCAGGHLMIASSRPSLNENPGVFYLCIAFGGCAGALANAFVFPVVFARVPTVAVDAYASAAIIIPGVLIYFREKIKPMLKNPYATGLCAGMMISAFVVIPFNFLKKDPSCVMTFRNYYGILKVMEQGMHRYLHHGSIIHGVQSIKQKDSRHPLFYYRENGPFGEIFSELKPKNPKIALVGLGIGSLLGYSKPGYSWDVYEINPAVIKTAGKYFCYLDTSPGNIRIIEGDARLMMQKTPKSRYDLIIIDAYSGDAIPSHLITKEAFSLFLDKLAPKGMIVLHTSNRFLDLRPLAAALCRYKNAGFAFKLSKQGADDLEAAVELAAASRSKEVMDSLVNGRGWSSETGLKKIKIWEDEMINILDVIMFKTIIKDLRLRHASK